MFVNFNIVNPAIKDDAEDSVCVIAGLVCKTDHKRLMTVQDGKGCTLKKLMNKCSLWDLGMMCRQSEILTMTNMGSLLKFYGNLSKL